jgi:hypothetical protein
MSAKLLHNGDISVYRTDKADGTFIVMIVHNKIMLTEDIASQIHGWVTKFGKEKKAFRLYSDANNIMLSTPETLKKCYKILADSKSNDDISKPEKIAILTSAVGKTMVEAFSRDFSINNIPMTVFTNKKDAWNYINK